MRAALSARVRVSWDSLHLGTSVGSPPSACSRAHLHAPRARICRASRERSRHVARIAPRRALLRVKVELRGGLA